MKIKLVAILLFSFLSSSISYSQPTPKKYYGSVGFIFNFFNSDELNSIVDRYNSNPNVSTKLDKIGFFFGPNLIIGMNLLYEKSFLNVEFGFSYLLSGKNSSRYVESGVTKIEDVKIQIPLINVGLNYFLEAAEVLNIGAGFALSVGTMNLLNRDYNRISPTPEYTYLNQNNFSSYIGVTPSLYLNYILSKNFTLSLRPNYFILLRSQDFSSLNSALNPGSSFVGLNSSSMNGPGISLNFMFKLGR